MIAALLATLCTMCHPDVRVQFENSIHGREEVTCVSCHGGDPRATTVAGAHDGGFRGAIPRRQIPSLCASCHADAEMMRPWNLPTDQYALYQTSHHGRRLAQGDDKVAVCTDCHGVHDILATDDPRSRVFPQNVPDTCSRCHSDAALMARYGLSGDPRADYVAGVHGEALLKKGDPAAPGCARCHGAHGAAPPGVGDVDKVCGQCHVKARAHFLDSPHRAAMPAAGLPECASCHGNHRVAAADVSRIESVCRNCHAEGSPPLDLASKMKTLHTGAAEEIEKARELVERAAQVPLYTEDYRARLEEARTALTESLPAMHSLDLDRVESLTQRARSIGTEVESEVNGKLDERWWRRIGLLVFWFYLVVTIAILLRFRARTAA